MTTEVMKLEFAAKDRSPGGPGGSGTREVSSLAGRIFNLRNLFSILLAAVVLYLVFRLSFDFEWREVWGYVRATDLGLFALATVVFYFSYFVRAMRWKNFLGNVGYSRAAGQPMPSTHGLARILYLAQFANTITVARLGDAYRAYLLMRSAGVSLAVTLGTVLAERLLDLAVLAALLSTTILLAFRGTLPQEATVVLLAGLALSVIGIAGLLLMPRMRTLVEKVLPTRFHRYYERFEHGTIDSLGRVPSLVYSVALSVVGWALECASLYLVAASVGAPLTVGGAVVVALVAALLAVVPFTLSGLGLAEGGMVLVLKWLGLGTNPAGAVAILSRLISYWSIVFLGFLLYLYDAGNPVKARLAPLSAERKEC